MTLVTMVRTVLVFALLQAALLTVPELITDDGGNYMISPTGNGIRNDIKGSGYYGAKRGDRRHNGTDYQCTPDQEVVSPINGRIVRLARPYANDNLYSGLIIQGDSIKIKMFYLKPLPDIVGKKVRQGDVIGFAQDISARKLSYKGMQPHIHLEIASLDPDILVSQL